MSNLPSNGDLKGERVAQGLYLVSVKFSGMHVCISDSLKRMGQVRNFSVCLKLSTGMTPPPVNISLSKGMGELEQHTTYPKPSMDLVTVPPGFPGRPRLLPGPGWEPRETSLQLCQVTFCLETLCCVSFSFTQTNRVFMELLGLQLAKW